MFTRNFAPDCNVFMPRYDFYTINAHFHGYSFEGYKIQEYKD